MSGASEERALVRHLDVGPLGQLIPFNIRNGKLTDVRSVLCKATLPSAYHWLPIRNLEPTDALAHVGAFIRMHMAQLTMSGVAATDEPLRHKLAVVLGTSRATMTAYYNLTDQDFIPGELRSPMYEAVKGETGAVEIRHAQGLSEALVAELNKNFELTASDLLAIPAIHICSVGLPAVQGYSIEMTGHHYLSVATSQSFKAYQVMEKAHWQTGDVSQYWSTNVTEMRDALWHKAGHPITMTIKRGLAFDPVLPLRLRDSGAGPAASRLPAEEPTMRAAGSFITLGQTCQTLFQVAKGDLNCDKLVAARDAVHMFPGGDRDQVTNVVLPPGVPPSVNTRAKAIDYLQRLMDANANKVAYAFGFYVALSEQSMAMGTGDAVDTLKVSHSLTKLKSQSHAAYIAGSQAYGDYAAARARARADGKLFLPKFVIE